MKLLIRANQIEGCVTAPPSKSEAQRYLVGALLADNQTSVIKNIGKSTDVLATKAAIQSLGATIENIDEQTISIFGVEKILSTKQLFCGESGLGMRLLMPVAALQPEAVMLTGSGSLLFRKQEGYREALPAIGVFFATSQGYPPVIVRGPVQGGRINLAGKYGSQYLSGLLFALPKASKDSFLKIETPTSKPYIQLTLETLRQFGVSIEVNEALDTFKIPGNQQFFGTEATVNGDWSSAAFLAAAAAINGKVRLSGLQSDSYQADKKILLILQAMGASYYWEKTELFVQHTSDLQGVKEDLTHCPDLFPVVAILACFAKTASFLRGISRLRGKESDRAIVIQEQFSKTGATITLDEVSDTMIIQPAKQLASTAVIRPHNDHRIAMAGALAAFFLPKGVIIDEASCVQKSFPDYWATLRQLGFKIQVY